MSCLGLQAGLARGWRVEAPDPHPSILHSQDSWQGLCGGGFPPSSLPGPVQFQSTLWPPSCQAVGWEGRGEQSRASYHVPPLLCWFRAKPTQWGAVLSHPPAWLLLLTSAGRSHSLDLCSYLLGQDLGAGGEIKVPSIVWAPQLAGLCQVRDYARSTWQDVLLPYTPGSWHDGEPHRAVPSTVQIWP